MHQIYQIVWIRTTPTKGEIGKEVLLGGQK